MNLATTSFQFKIRSSPKSPVLRYCSTAARCSGVSLRWLLRLSSEFFLVLGYGFLMAYSTCWRLTLSALATAALVHFRWWSSQHWMYPSTLFLRGVSSGFPGGSSGSGSMDTSAIVVVVCFCDSGFERQCADFESWRRVPAQVTVQVEAVRLAGTKDTPDTAFYAGELDRAHSQPNGPDTSVFYSAANQIAPARPNSS